MISTKVKQYALEYIRSLDVNSDLKAAILESTVINKFIAGLAKEIQSSCDSVYIKKHGKLIPDHSIKAVVKDFINVLMLQIEDMANKRSESDLARIAREQAIQKQKDLELTVSGTPSGEYAEGIEVVQ